MCEPWSADGLAACEDGSAHFVGELDCRGVGAPCPDSGFPEDLPADRSVAFVRSGAEGGDGSRARPWATLTQALAERAPGMVIAIASGTYDEALELRADVELWGACARDTVLELAPDAPAQPDATVTVRSGTASLRNLTIRGGARHGLVIKGSAAHAVLTGVVVQGAARAGIICSHGGQLVANDILVRDTQPAPGAGDLGRGMAAEVGASLELRAAVVTGNRDVGIFVGEGATANLRQVAVLGTASRADDGTFWRGLVVQDGAQLTGEEIVVEGNRDIGVSVSDAPTQVSLERALLRDTEGAAGVYGPGGRGLEAFLGAKVDLKSTWVADNHTAGLSATDSGTTVRLEDVAITGTRSNRTRQFGRAINLQRGARLDATRVHVEANRDNGLLAASVGTVAVLEDLVILDTEAQALDGRFGRGLAIEHGAQLGLTRGVVSGSHDLGVAVLGPGSRADFQGLTVTRTEPRPCADSWCPEEAFGSNVAVAGGASASVENFEISEAALCGVQIATDGALDLRHGVVRSCLTGACVQVAGYDVGRLEQDVRFVDNQAGLQATTLPVPDVAGEL